MHESIMALAMMRYLLSALLLQPWREIKCVKGENKKRGILMKRDGIVFNSFLACYMYISHWKLSQNI